MKKLLFSLSLLASVAAVADDDLTGGIDVSAQTTAVMTLVNTTDTSFILAVPWVTATNAAATTISVADIVDPSTLSTGDILRWYDTSAGGFKVWQLVETAGVKVWNPVSTVTASKTLDGSNAGETFVKRGDAVILYRANPAANGGIIRLSGQYIALSSSDTTTVTSSSSAAVYALIAPPVTADYDINSLIWTVNGCAVTSDEAKAVIPRGASTGLKVIANKRDGKAATYYLDSSDKTTKAFNFGLRKGSWTSVPAQAAGQGFWFVVPASADTLTFTLTWGN